jgi:hypothetical protein
MSGAVINRRRSEHPIVFGGRRNDLSKVIISWDLANKTANGIIWAQIDSIGVIIFPENESNAAYAAAQNPSNVLGPPCRLQLESVRAPSVPEAASPGTVRQTIKPPR